MVGKEDADRARREERRSAESPRGALPSGGGFLNRPDGQPLIVDPGVLHETTPDGRVILWLPGERTGGYQGWERVVTVAQAEVVRREGVCSIEVTAIPARQRLGRRLGRWLRGRRPAQSDESWTLPGGAQAQAVRSGGRRTGLRLIWAEEGAAARDEEQIRSLRPRCRE